MKAGSTETISDWADEKQLPGDACVYFKTLCLQKSNAIALETGRESIYMALEIAKLQLQSLGAGLALFHLQDDSGFLENKMSL